MFCVELRYANLDVATLRRVRMNVLVKEGVLGAILLIVGVFDRLYIDWYWVGRTKVWIIPGTEDLMPCMPQSDRGARRVSGWHGGSRDGGIVILRG